CHLLNNGGNDRYSDIVIRRPSETVILELLATRTEKEVEEHLDRTAEYKDILQADDAWVVHFTCEDGYTLNPQWQSDNQLTVNMVHFWHDIYFTTIRMSARWKDESGHIQQIDNQPLVCDTAG